MKKVSGYKSSILLLIICHINVDANDIIGVTKSGREYYEALIEEGMYAEDQDDGGKKRLAHDHVARGQSKNKEAKKQLCSMDLKNSSVNNNYKEEISPGRHYYHSLIDKATEKRWVIPLSIDGSFVDNAFNDQSQKDTLAQLIFGQNFTVKDILLFSKLSDDNKVRIRNIGDTDPATRRERGGTPVGMGSGEVVFGGFRDDLFTTLLAPARINIDAEQREVRFDISAAYRFYFTDEENVQGVVGAHIPIKSRLHIMILQINNGALLNGGITTTEDAFKQFSREFISINDFFQRAILEPKKLIFESLQRETGVGDISLFALIDAANAFEYLDGLQAGVNLVFPSGGKLKGDRVWEIVLGNGGAFQGDVFVQALFSSPSAAFNPSIRLAAEFSAPFTAKRRVPKLKTNEDRVMANEVEELITVDPFDDFFVDPFKESDTTIPFFADRAVSTRTKLGSHVLIGIANYFYNALNLGFRLGIFYDFSHKSKDKLTVNDECKTGADIFNTAVLEERTDTKSHRIGWQLAYKFKNMVELNIGSQHVFSGKNVPLVHEIFASLVAVF